MRSPVKHEVHHVACLLGYGANAVVPYLAQRTIEQLTRQGQLSGTVAENVATYTNVLSEGVIKVMAKWAFLLYKVIQGAQIFEAVGLSNSVIEKYFTGTQSKLSGISIEQIDKENKARQSDDSDYLESEVYSNGDSKVSIMHLILVRFFIAACM